MKSSYIYAELCFVILLLTACNKNDNNSPTGQILQAGKWQISASVSTFMHMGKDTTVESYSNWEACEQDDYMVFEAKGKGSSNENSNKCPEDNQEDEFTWELQEHDTKLQITLKNGGQFISNGDKTTVFDILEVNENQLRLQSPDVRFGESARTIETYTNIR